MRAGSASRSALKFKLGDWAEGVDESFDLILCNPPYVAEGAELGPGVREFEPDEALFAGETGLDAYRALAPQLPRLLNHGGLAAVEIGPDQAEAGHRACSRATGLQARVANDLADRPRAVLLTWSYCIERNCLAFGVGRTTSVVWAGPAPDQLQSAPVPTPDAIGRSFALGAQTGTRGSERARARAQPCPSEAKGLATTA